MKPSNRIVLLVVLAASLPLAAAGKKPDLPAAQAAPPHGVAQPASPTAFPGGSVTFFGDLSAGDPAFNRSLSGIPCPGLSATGTAVFYDAYSLTNTTAGSINVIIHMTAPGGGLAAFDTFVHAYSPNFNPAAPMGNCIGANDDGPGGVGESLLNSVPVPAGQALVVVADSFSNGEVGQYGLCVTDQGAACTTPAELVNFQVL